MNLPELNAGRLFLQRARDLAPNQPLLPEKARPPIVFKKEALSLEPYTGVWDMDAAAHLLRRTIFGPQAAEIGQVKDLGLESALEILLEELPLPAPPLNIAPNDPVVPLGQTWVNAAINNEVEGLRLQSLVAWWNHQFFTQGLSLREKMVLFWHNHFVTEIEIVADSRYSYRYANLLRQHALGNFQTLTEAITVSPAMLRYLNGSENRAGAPNENYARELFELFTIGKGPQIGEGNYTHYTEADVVAAARVLTGWRDRPVQIDVVFQEGFHDTGDKQFSEAFDNQVIGNLGAEEYKALIAMIFAREETARFLCRKLYRWLVYYQIDEAVEENIIAPLAQILRDHQYEIKPVLRALLGSTHFFSAEVSGAAIKSPIDFVVGTFRQLEIAFPASENLLAYYDAGLVSYYLTALQEMFLGTPPGVAGWPAYYQAPQWQQLWINSVSLPFRRQLSDALTITGLNRDGYRLETDPIALILALEVPDDPNRVVEDLARRFFPLALTDNQKLFLKNTLIPGLPDFEWTAEWNGLMANPQDEALRMAVSNKVRALLNRMLALAEYHLQ
ncbi:MAG: DUF1800 domain-containing protein [Microscillaceae bacterium]|nr:DUF1800 domain-containing protein [Microscillaceae bacterium]